MGKIQDRQDVHEFIRGQIATLLSECTEHQRGRFVEIFGHGPENLTTSELQNAIDLCERTVRSNEKRGEP